MFVPILNVLNKLDFAEINKFAPYLLNNDLNAEQYYPNLEQLHTTGYNMDEFALDNQKVMTWFAQLNQRFGEWLMAQGKKSAVTIQATGSRSFGASYTESDLECAVVSDRFEDFLDFCRFLHSTYKDGHNFIAIKTLAGLPLLIIKGDAGFCCPELAAHYPGKTLPQLEITYRQANVHELIQDAGNNFFAELNNEELTSYVYNKRHIELMQRSASIDAVVDDMPLKRKVLEEFKGALSKALKCLPAGQLQETPAFNSEVFQSAVKPPISSAETGQGFFSLASATSSAMMPSMSPSTKF